jgi:hypothetical protein
LVSAIEGFPGALSEALRDRLGVASETALRSSEQTLCRTFLEKAGSSYLVSLKIGNHGDIALLQIDSMLLFPIVQLIFLILHWGRARKPFFLVLWGAGIASGVQFGAQVTKRQPARELVESLTWMFYEMGLARTSADLVNAIAQLQGYSRALVAFLSQWDVFLTPVLAQRPLPIGYLDTDGADPQAEFRKAVEYAPFTAHWNLTGQPAISPKSTSLGPVRNSACGKHMGELPSQQPPD